MFVVALLAAISLNNASADDWTPLWSTTSLPQASADLSATSAGGKVFFAGGLVPGNFASNVVDIYDTATNTWSTTTLSSSRESIGCTSLDGKVFFAGGITQRGGYSGAVDIYDTTAATWSTTSLSLARFSPGAAAADGKVVFAGGYVNGSVTNRVDIYDLAAGTWSTLTLSAAQSGPASVAVGNKLLFGDGWCTSAPYAIAHADIYDTAAGTWSTAPLSQARFDLAAASAGGMALFAGGNVNSVASNTVDIYNSSNDQWLTSALSQPRMDLAAASLDDKIFFGGGRGSYAAYTPSNVVDIYDVSKGTWSVATLSQARYGLAATSTGNQVFFAGGYTNSVGTMSSVVDIYTLQNYGTITSSRAWTLVDQTNVTALMQVNAPGSLNLATFGLNVGSMSGNAPIDLDSGTLTTGSDNTNATYAGNISDAGTLVKIGGGALALYGSNTYSGPTTVNQGKLTVDGSLTNSAVRVQSGGILSGTGSLTSVTVSSGGTLAPGDSQGVMHLSGSLSLAAGAKLDYDLDGNPADNEVSMPSAVLALDDQQFSDFNFMFLAGFGRGVYTLIDASSVTGSLGLTPAA